MHKSTLLDVLDAAHLSVYVSGPFPERGGVMIVGPPESLKTSMMNKVFTNHPDASVMGDANVKTLTDMRPDLLSGKYNTIAFPEFPKLYERRADTAKHVEGTIRQLVDEGFIRPSFVDQRAASSPARCLVIGAMTEGFYSLHFKEWLDSGFLRRFIWCVINIRNRRPLMAAIRDWERLDLGSYQTKVPGSGSIPFHKNPVIASELEAMIREQPGGATPLILMQKIYSVLRWKYEANEPGKAINILRDFAPCLKKDSYAEIFLDTDPPTGESYTDHAEPGNNRRNGKSRTATGILRSAKRTHGKGDRSNARRKRA